MLHFLLMSVRRDQVLRTVRSLPAEKKKSRTRVGSTKDKR